MRYVYYLSIAILPVIIPLVALAQFGQPGSNTGPQIELSERFPEPRQQIQATVRNIPNIGAGELTWHVDGQLQSNFTNQTTITLTAQSITQPTTIHVEQNNQRIASTAFAPVYLDIIVEPNTITPRMYQGRALPSAGSLMTLTALFDIDPRFLSNAYRYTWRVNNSVIGDGPQSSNRVTVPTPNRQSTTVSVTIIHPEYGVVGERQITVPITRPTVHFYKLNALYGMSQTALQSDEQVTGNTLTVRGIPYYLPVQAIDGNQQVSWSVNGREQAGSQNDAFAVTLNRTDQPQRLQFQLRNPRSTLYQVTETLRLHH